jgi:3-oxoadipate enol-lactonase
MPFAVRDGVRIYWKLEGAESKTPLVLLNSIGTDMSMWDRAVPALLRDFLILRIDTRGHGASDAPVGDYNMEVLARDVVAVMDAAGFSKAAVAGVSLGGMIAMELALSSPERVAGLGLVATTATLYSSMWHDRIAKVRAEGMVSIADTVMTRFLTDDFIASRPEYAETVRRTLLSTPAEGYAGCGAAIRDMALMDRLPDITAPTVVIVGRDDVSTPLAGNGDELLKRIPDATLEETGGPHITPMEDPEGVSAVLTSHLA